MPRIGGQEVYLYYLAKNPTIEEIKEAVIPKAKKYGISPIWLIGDYAEGTQYSESSIDILVDSKDGLGMFYMGCDLTNELNKMVIVLERGYLSASGEIPFDGGDLIRTKLKNIVSTIKNKILLYDGTSDIISAPNNCNPNIN